MITFKVSYVVGLLTIFVGSLTIPSNPYEIVPAVSSMSFDKPMWLALFLVIGFFYSLGMYAIYDKWLNPNPTE